MQATAASLTVTCHVHLDLTDGREIDAALFLPTDPARPGGSASVEAILDGNRDFIPAGIDGGSGFISRLAIRSVEMAADGPGAPDLPEGGGTVDVVTLVLDSGKEVSGILHTFAPPEAMRMSDVFNRPGRFLTLSVGDRVLLVSKAHIVQVSF